VSGPSVTGNMKVGLVSAITPIVFTLE